MIPEIVTDEWLFERLSGTIQGKPRRDEQLAVARQELDEWFQSEVTKRVHPTHLAGVGQLSPDHLVISVSADVDTLRKHYPENWLRTVILRMLDGAAAAAAASSPSGLRSFGIIRETFVVAVRAYINVYPSEAKP